MDMKILTSEKRIEIFKLAKVYGAKNLRIFGSVARGTVQLDSDIDNDIVWAVLSRDLPELKKKIDDILNEE